MPVHAGIQELLEQVTLNEFLQFAVLGLGAGSAYVLLGQGLVVIYRGAGIVNFAQGAMAMVAAFAFWDLHEQREWAFWPAFLCGVALAAALGALTHLLVMRPMRGASPLARLIATLGVLSVLTAAATLRYGTVEQIVRTSLPDDVWRVNWLGLEVAVSADRIWLLAIAVALTLGLSVLYGHTRFGVAVSAAAENELAASTLGWSPDVLATVNWTIGAGLAGVAGILIVALSGLQVYTLTLIVIAALAAALVGGFRSFPMVLVGGLGIGILQSEMSRYASDLLGPTRQQGFAQALPFGVIIVVLVVRGAGLPLRSYVLEKRPRLGTAVIRPLPIVVACAVVAAGALTVFSADVLDALLATALAGMIVLSLVVLTGYAGQVSLAQYALAGMGAFVAGRLVVATHWPFELAFLAGILATIPVGIVFAIPALRTRGVNLAVVTLGLGLAVQLVLFNNSEYTGGIAGTPVGKTEIFGLSIDAVLHEDRYLVFVLFWFVLACLVVANLRRSRAGRRLIAVRTNERAAASLGISVFGAKLHAFAVSAGIAGLGGILIGFRSRTIIYSDFGVFQSINSVLEAVIGGVGYIVGTLIGAQFAPDAIGGLAVEQLVDDPGQWLVLIAGVLVLVVLILKPDGIASVFDRTGRRARRQSEAAAPLAVVARQRVRPAVLEVEELCVRIGGLEILDGVCLTIRPGEVVALIGPNGAGKTMAIDAITGFTKASGSVRLDGVDLGGWSAVRRARAGLTRSFQSLELFEDVTVRENLQTACDSRDRRAYLSGLVWPGRQRLRPAAVAAVLEFDLEADLDRRPTEMPYGRRRLVGIARAVATEPSVLLLDEPAAGLDDAESADLARLVRLLADEWAMAVLLVEHDMSMVMSVSDRIVVLESGKEIAQGTPDVVRRDPAVQLAYLGEPVEAVVGATQEPAASGGAEGSG